MKLDWRRVRALLAAELRMVLRDRRTVYISIILPLVTMPLILLASTWMNQARERKVSRMECLYAVAGSQAAAVRAWIEDTRARVEGQARTNPTAAFRYREVFVASPAEALRKGQVHLVLEGQSAAEYQARARAASGREEPRVHRSPGPSASERADDAGEVPDRVPVIQMLFRADRDESSTACNRLEAALRETRRARQDALLRERGFPVARPEVGRIAEVNLATPGQKAGLTLGKTLTLMLLLFILTGGAVVAADSIAGERERGTLETLLTTAVGRAEIVVAKHGVILVTALAITLIQALNLLVYVSLKLLPGAAQFTAAVPPLVALLLLLLYLPVAALISSVLLFTSACAKTYKEAQLYFLPVLLLGLVPALAPLAPGLPLRSAILVVPIANLAVAVREILSGVFDWPAIAAAWFVTGATALAATRFSIRFLSAERLVAAVDTDAVDFAGGAPLFERHVGRWFVALWSLLVVAGGYMEGTDVRWQLAFNLGALFLGGSVLMLWRYRLNPREALALRAPPPAAWLAVVCAVPGAMIAGAGLFRLVNVFLPIPTEIIEAFGTALLPAGWSGFEAVLFLAVLPGVCEEVAFRGLLLHGLRRRLSPVLLALVVGAVFGLFHLNLFRLASTGFLGVLLAAVTLLTGSLYPAILWHILNNWLAVVAFRRQIPLDELEPSGYLLGAGLLAAAFWILWRVRTPYPDLRRRVRRDAPPPS